MCDWTLCFRFGVILYTLHYDYELTLEILSLSLASRLYSLTMELREPVGLTLRCLSKSTRRSSISLLSSPNLVDTPHRTVCHLSSRPTRQNALLSN